MKTYYVYILLCIDGTYYTGITSRIEERLAEHSIGLDINSYTYSRRPVKLVALEMFQNPVDAIAREKQVKNWSRRKKKALIDKNWDELIAYAKGKNRSSLY
ncbi:MAG: GIY-YIG nuclease family protein [Calditrichota bacterium]